MPTDADRPRPAASVAKCFAVVPVVLAVLWLVGANLLIACGAITHWSSALGPVDVSFGNAYTLLPGRITMHDLVLRARWGDTEVSMHAARMHVRVGLLSLLGGVPEIRGESDELRSLGVGSWAYEGPAEVEARLDVASGRAIVERGSIVLRGGELRHGGELLVDGARGTIVVDHVELAKGTAGSVDLAGRAFMRGRVDSLVVPIRLPGIADHARVVGRGGNLSIAFAVQDGAFVPGGFIRYAPDELRIQRGSLVARGRATVAVDVLDEGLVVRLDQRDVRIDRRGRDDILPARTDRVALTLTTARTLDHGGGWWGQLHPTEVRVPDARWLTTDASDIVVERGEALAVVGATLADEIVVEAALVGRDFATRIAPTSAGGDVVLRGRLTGSGSGLLLERAELRVEDATIRTGGGTVHDWHMVAWADELELGERPRISGDFVAVFADTRPLVQAVAATTAVPRRVARALVVRDLRVGGNAQIDSATWDVVIDEARAESVELTGRWRRTIWGSRAALLVQSGRRALGVRWSEQGLVVRPFATRAWLARELARLPSR